MKKSDDTTKSVVFVPEETNQGVDVAVSVTVNYENGVLQDICLYADERLELMICDDDIKQRAICYADLIIEAAESVDQ